MLLKNHQLNYIMALVTCFKSENKTKKADNKIGDCVCGGV